MDTFKSNLSFTIKEELEIVAQKPKKAKKKPKEK